MKRALFPLLFSLATTALAGEGNQPPTVGITTPAADAVITSLTGIGGTATDDVDVASVSFTLREVAIPGGSDRWWNGSAWQSTPHNFDADGHAGTWSAAEGFVFPPLNSGRAFRVEAQAMDGSGQSSAVATRNFSATTTVLNWDDGATSAGTVAITQPNAHGGDYYFKVVTQGVAAGGWRTMLDVTSGESAVYLKKGGLPTPGDYQSKSDRTGDDGFVLHTSQFAASEEWFILVRATTGAQWRLVTGEVNVQSLGTLAADSSSGSGSVTIGPEGMKFFRTTIPGNTLAWRLWLNGDGRTMLVKKADIAHPASHEVNQAAQMLLVPPYLTSGDYFVTVSGAPGDTINLDSRQQAVTDINFTSTTVQNVTGYGYTTYRVQVPIQQIAWEVQVTPSSGDANLAIRRNEVPNEFVHTAYSQATGNVTDSVTLVPETLSDGTFYITVYGSGAHNFTLTSGNPVITDINFTTQIVNDAPNKVGWRFYRIVDTAQQLGHLGWELFLENQPSGTELAIRRNAVPGRWVAYSHPFGGYHIDQSSTDGYLQRPGHQADVYYIGVYHATTTLSTFTLNTRPLPATTVNFNGAGSSVTVNNQPANRFQFFRVDVPSGVLGWNLRLKNVSGLPRLVVRRDALPDGLSSTIHYGLHASTWPSGYQFIPYTDWTGFAEDASGANRYSQLLVTTMDYPLEPGTYYVGVSAYSHETAPLSYTLESRGIGGGQAITVADLDFASGSATVGALAEREAAYYRVVVPANTPSWRLRLNPTSGDALLLVNKDRPPNLDTGRHFGGGPPMNARVQRLGKEHYLILPESGESTIPAGTYYLAVVSQGVGPTTTRSGTGDAAFTLQSHGSIAITPIGTLGAVGAADLTVSGSVEAGEVKVYSLTVPTGTLVLETQLEATTGSPELSLASGTDIPSPTVIDSYGVRGGASRQLSLPRYDGALLDTLGNPAPGTYTFAVKGSRPLAGGELVDASFTARFRAAEPETLAFNNGSANVSLQTGGTWRFYRVVVPDDASLKGWDLRLENVTQGNPVLHVRRDLLPVGNGSSGSVETWPSGAEFSPQTDLSGFPNDSSGVSVTGRRMVVGMGSPLEPGVYYVGIRNYSGTGSMAYTLVSRGIGDGYAIPVNTLTFTGGSAVVNNLAAREVAWFKVNVPVSTPGWKFKLAATSGESRLLWRRGALPSMADYPHTRHVAKPGDEHFTLVPPDGQSFLAAGDYYLAVVSEGVGPDYFNGRIGTGAIEATLQSIGQLTPANFTVTNLGTVSAGGIAQADTLAYGETKAYEFSVPGGTHAFTVRLEGVTGNPEFRAVAGNLFPYAPYTSGGDGYGFEGGTSTGATSAHGTSILTVPNPATGTWRIVVKGNFLGADRPAAAFTLRVQSQTYEDVAFRNGTVSVTGQAGGTWRYFRFVVPSGVDGWHLRLSNVTSGANPQMWIRRDLLPDPNLSSNVAGYQDNWPSGGQYYTPAEWTGRSYSASGAQEYYNNVVLGMGQPLQPGTYIVGVQDYGTAAFSYTLTSRAIGAGEAIPVNTLDFAGGSASISSLMPRDIAWYRVTVPASPVSWKLRLAATAGESMFVINRGFIPSGGGSPEIVRKEGNEHFLYLPGSFNGFAGGDYFIGVVSEGVNPPNANQVGTGGISATLESQGPIAVAELGTLGGTDIVQAGALEGGEVKAYRFAIPTGAVNVEVRLENRTGDPFMVLQGGLALPNPRFSAGDSYGSSGGVDGLAHHTSVINLVNPFAGTYTLTVRARGSTANIADAGYTLRIRQPVLPALNFDAALNSGGGSHTDSASLAENEKKFYRVEIPATLNDLPVIGWRLDLNASQGSPQLRYRKDFLPDNSSSTYSGSGGTTIVVPPVFSPGTWYLEVSGSSGTTSYQLTSLALVLQRPAWTMPAAGQSPNTLGLTPPLFADTGVDTAGTPLAGDQGVDLAQGDFHYYAVDVPDGNAGLLRARLDAISGNPDLYVRVGSAPTINQRDRALNGSGSEYANWVPVDGRFERQLKPGRWYFAVHAAGLSNVRYRLRLSTGDVQDLALNGGSLADQLLAAGDWRYYRVQIPFNAPNNWQVTFSQNVGDVVMHVRDVVPPGEGIHSSDRRDWQSDDKNLGPYASYDPPGTHSFTLPPLRPGSVYYLGFRAVNDATFSVSSSTSGGTLGTLPTIGFYNTTFNDTVPAQTARMYRIDVPADALRWKHTSTHPADVLFTLFPGTVPAVNQTPLWASRSASFPYDPVANAALNQSLASQVWPWAPAQSFYLVVSNASASVQAFTLNMDGRNASNEDGDEDGVLDAWEVTHFGDIFSYDGNSDPDGDGMPNRLEFAAGTNPNNNTSYFPTLNLTTVGGTVAASPNQEYFTFGQQVQLTATPNSGLSFIGWSGDLTGAQNPITLNMNTSKFITATFRVANDNLADAGVITGTSATRNAANALATKETDEPNHAGNPGGKSLWWTWTPAVSGQATISTIGSSFDTLLAVYTGSALASLSQVAADDDSGTGGGTSLVQFSAVAGTAYRIAVDGFAGASGDIVLNLNQVAPPANDNFANRIVLTGSTAQGTSSTTSASSEVNEPVHWTPSAGKSVWWSWTAPVTAPVTISTAGSNFDTVLAVYTGSSLGSLVLRASDDIDTIGSHTSSVAFFAIAGTTYQIAVDGWNAATGNVTLNLSQGTPVAFATPVRLGNGHFQFTINGPNGSGWEVRASTDLVNWNILIASGTFTGTPITVTDTDALNHLRRFYRIQAPAP